MRFRNLQPSTFNFQLLLVLAISAASFLTACGSHSAKSKQQEFFTSGSKEADQRASQRMAKAEQLSGSGEGSGETDSKSSNGGSKPPGQPATAENKLALFDRLGAEKGITAIVNDFTERVLQDPRVNWERQSVSSGGLFHHTQGPLWRATPDNVTRLKTHMVQFLSLATGGPAHYDGKQIKPAHAGMKIANPEFDAALGDLKASLDKLKIANREQKELLAIIESTRPQIVEQR